MAGERFGELLRRLRTDRGLTQEQVAGRALLSTRAISDLERGINRTAAATPPSCWPTRWC